jgi:hypothetical protein
MGQPTLSDRIRLGDQVALSIAAVVLLGAAALAGVGLILVFAPRFSATHHEESAVALAPSVEPRKVAPGNNPASAPPSANASHELAAEAKLAPLAEGPKEPSTGAPSAAPPEAAANLAAAVALSPAALTTAPVKVEPNPILAKVPAKGDDFCGTTVSFVATPRLAQEQAAMDDKLVFVLHISGNFEDPGFT